MKTEEDEAFDELERRQGGGFSAKRAMAADKLHWSDCAVHNAPAYPAGPCDCGVEKEPPSEWAGIKAILDEYGLQAIDFVADFKAALAGREWNFCERCGKRTKDLTVIHTCTPPQEGA